MDFKLLIAGLGNPGEKYHSTRHNFGFMLVDHFLALGEERKSMRLTRMEESGDFELWSVNLGGVPCLMCKPMTYMNLSGKAVSKICGRHTLSPKQVLVAHDELDLSLGRMKLKQGGGNNGHRGLESITECLNTSAFYRLRLGIGRPQAEHYDISTWVLEEFSSPDASVIDEVITAAAKGINLFLRRGASLAQQQINSFRPKKNDHEKPVQRTVDS